VTDLAVQVYSGLMLVWLFHTTDLRLTLPINPELHCTYQVAVMHPVVTCSLEFLCPGIAYSGETVEQEDIATTLATLLAVPIPVDSIGVLISSAMTGLTIADQLKAAYINAVQLQRVAKSSVTDYAQSKHSCLCC